MNEGTFMTTLQITRDQLLARIPSAFDEVGGQETIFESPIESSHWFYPGDRERSGNIPVVRVTQRMALSTIGENYRVQLTYGDEEEKGMTFHRFDLYDVGDSSERPILVCSITYLYDPRHGIGREIYFANTIDGPQPFDTLGRFYRDLLEFFKLIPFIEG